MSSVTIQAALSHIFRGIQDLKGAYPNRAFTIDGRLVGDIGEIIASIEYDLVLHETSQPSYDAETPDGRKVQIKATFQDQLTFRTVPDYYLGFKLFDDGRHEEVFNGPGEIIRAHFSHRKDIGVRLLSFPIVRLRELSASVPDHQRISKRGAP